MKKSRKDIIETLQLITSVLTLAVTVVSLIRLFINWSEKFD